MYYWNAEEVVAFNLAIQAIDEDLEKWRNERRERRAAARAAREARRRERAATAPIPSAETLRVAAH